MRDPSKKIVAAVLTAAEKETLHNEIDGRSSIPAARAREKEKVLVIVSDGRGDVWIISAEVN
jgi:hypothetical protein